MVSQAVQAACLLLALFLAIPAQANELAVGSKARVMNYLDLPLNRLENFNRMNCQQILNMRAVYVMRAPQLLAEPYQADDEIFGQIVDGKPWWGLRGTFVYGSGGRAPDGDSEESRFVLNPYLLVGLNSWSSEIWNTNAITDSDLSRPDFPYCWHPDLVRYHPRKQVVQVVYDITRFNNGLKTYDSRRKDHDSINNFGLVAYNARDFGYHWIYVPVEQSVNIVNELDPRAAVEIGQFIHCGGSCGFVGGCNNMSPAIDSIDHFKLERLPATIKVLLWKEKPNAVTETPDLTVMIELR